MAAIDIGVAAFDGNSSVSPPYTYQTKANPANDTGTLTYIEIQTTTATINIRIGTFYVNGENYTCRGSVNLGNVAGAGVATYDAPGDFAAFAVSTGDYLGCKIDSGGIERESAGGGGILYVEGEYIDPGDTAAYSAASGYISIYATGTAGGTARPIPRIMAHMRQQWN